MSDKVELLIQQNPFIRMLAQLHNGALASEAADELAHAVEAVKKTGKKASLALTITINPEGKGEVVAIEASGKLAPKLPKRDQRATTFFVDDKNQLTRHDPNQREIEFTRAPAQAVASN